MKGEKEIVDIPKLYPSILTILDFFRIINPRVLTRDCKFQGAETPLSKKESYLQIAWQNR